MPDFVPHPEAELKPWLVNLKDKATPQALTFNIPAADLTDLGAKIETYGETLDALADFTVRARQATQEKNMAKKAVTEAARALAKSIKAHKAYNPGFGQLLRIEGSDEPVDLTNAKPQLEGKGLAGGGIELTFHKSSSEGVNIYSQREGENGFNYLARDTHSPYVDNRPCPVTGKPEVRRYKAIYVLEDEQVGLFSDEVVVICQS